MEKFSVLVRVRRLILALSAVLLAGCMAKTGPQRSAEGLEIPPGYDIVPTQGNLRKIDPFPSKYESHSTKSGHATPSSVQGAKKSPSQHKKDSAAGA